MKTWKIIQLILWIVIVFVLVGILLAFLFGNMSFAKIIRQGNQVELLNQTESMEGVREIRLDLINADVAIVPSDTEEISVRYEGPDSLKDDVDLAVSTGEGKITVTQERTRFGGFLFWNWDWAHRDITLELPESYTGSLDIGNASGNLSITGSYELASYKSKLTSGNVKISEITCEDFSLSGTSGNLTLGKVDAGTYSIDLTSGTIDAEELRGDGKVEATSGNIDLGKVVGTADISAMSGKIEISSLSGGGMIRATSGNLRITVAESLRDLDVKASSGNISITLGEGTAYKIAAACSSGRISADFPLSYTDSGGKHAEAEFGESPEFRLDVSVTSGNIHFAG